MIRDMVVCIEMREILFKGKRKDNGEWIEGSSINTQYDVSGKKHVYIGIPVISEMYPLMQTIEWIEVIPETVGQYTGLTDKNGKKIFEGDILEFSDRYVVVFWHTPLSCWDSNFLKLTNRENGRDDMSPLNWGYTSKVIGNKHDTLNC